MNLILFRKFSYQKLKGEASKYFHKIKIEGTKDATDTINIKKILQRRDRIGKATMGENLQIIIKVGTLPFILIKKM